MSREFFVMAAPCSSTPASAGYTRPHWLATDGSRIVVVNEPAPTAERRMWMLNLNPMTGELALDRAFRDIDSTRPGIAFDCAAWPHGTSGTGVPHGTVFGW